MPLYMDLHHIDPDISQEDLNKAHLKDLEVEDKYGISHKKYYVNFVEKTVFCLMQGPNKEAIHESHAEVHGVGPCNVIEVSSLTPTLDFHALIGEEGGKNEYDVALTRTGEIDTGFRTLILIWICTFSENTGPHYNTLFRLIKKHDGNIVKQPDNKIMASFLHAQDAFLCTRAISGYLSVPTSGLDYNIGVVTGKPVDETSSVIFEEAIEQLYTLCLLGKSGTAYIDSATRTLFEKGLEKPFGPHQDGLHFVSDTDFRLFDALGKIFEDLINTPEFKSEQFGKKLGLSKAQTYRKIKALTGMSPNTLIREIRLRRSLEALKQNGKSVAEIAYELGFNSPTYFTRVFRKRYEMLPTTFAKLSSRN